MFIPVSQRFPIMSELEFLRVWINIASLFIRTQNLEVLKFGLNLRGMCLKTMSARVKRRAQLTDLISRETAIQVEFEALLFINNLSDLLFENELVI